MLLIDSVEVHRSLPAPQCPAGVGRAKLDRDPHRTIGPRGECEPVVVGDVDRRLADRRAPDEGRPLAACRIVREAVTHPQLGPGQRPSRHPPRPARIGSVSRCHPASVLPSKSAIAAESVEPPEPLEPVEPLELLTRSAPLRSSSVLERGRRWRCSAATCAVAVPDLGAVHRRLRSCLERQLALPLRRQRRQGLGAPPDDRRESRRRVAANP